MARVHFVKKARKANRAAGIKKGDSYYWWSFRFGGKHYSKTPPRRSMTTQSAFYSTLWETEDSMNDQLDREGTDLQEIVEGAASEMRELADECQNSYDNMPDGLQQGDAGQLLQERVDFCNEIADEIEAVDLEDREAAIDELKGIDFSRV